MSAHCLGAKKGLMLNVYSQWSITYPKSIIQTLETFRVNNSTLGKCLKFFCGDIKMKSRDIIKATTSAVNCS